MIYSIPHWNAVDSSLRCIRVGRNWYATAAESPSFRGIGIIHKINNN